MRRLRTLALAVSACVLLGALADPAVASSSDPDAANEALRASMDEKAEQEAEDEFLEDEQRRSEPSSLVTAGFSPGYYIRDDGIAVVREFADSDGSVRRAAANLEHPVIFERSAYSAEGFNAVVLASSQLELSDGVSVGSSYDPRADVLAFEGNLAPELLAEQLGDVVYVYRFVPEDAPARFSGTRTSDSTPHYGGARINSNCSTGFTTKFNDNVRRMLTAAHCGALNSVATSGLHYVGTMTYRLPFPAYDVAWLASSTYTGVVYGGGSTGTAMLVGGSVGNPGMGGNYCASGAFGYEHCGMGVTSLSATFCDSGGCTPSLVTTNNTGVIPGDSGGPFYGKPASYALARGIVLGGNSSTVYFTPWQRIKSYYTSLEIVPG